MWEKFWKYFSIWDSRIWSGSIKYSHNVCIIVLTLFFPVYDFFNTLKESQLKKFFFSNTWNL